MSKVQPTRITLSTIRGGGGVCVGGGGGGGAEGRWEGWRG